MSTSPKIQMIAQLRKESECSLAKAKEALAATDFDYARAVAWLEKEMAASASKKAAKVAERSAAEGLIGVVSHPYVLQRRLM
ncbi:Elongation factor Ts, mitochondrial, partial [Kappamyces sp. JEL0680]